MDHDYVAQMDYVRHQLALVARLRGKHRRDISELVIRCRGCDERMLEVIRVDAPRGDDGSPQSWAAISRRVPDWVQRGRGPEQARRGEWKFVLIKWPITETPEPDELRRPYEVVCRGRLASLTERYVFDLIRAGTRIHRLPGHD